MANITVRKLPDNVHDALKARASSAHRSVEAEVRIILEQAVFPKDRVRLGDCLQSLGQNLNLTDAQLMSLKESSLLTSEMSLSR